MTQVGFCVISRWPLSGFLSNHKIHSYNGYSIYIAILAHSFEDLPDGSGKSSILFMQIISHISVILYWIPTRLGTEIYLNESFKCTKFQLDQSTYLYFMADFPKCAKRSRRKNVEQASKLCCSYLGNGWGYFLKI